MINYLKDYNFKKVILISIVLCILYAVSDEIHQYFVGRTASVFDVLIDSFGSFIGCSSNFLLLKNKIFSKI